MKALLTPFLVLAITACNGEKQTQTKTIIATVTLPTATVSCCGPSPEEFQMVWPELTDIVPIAVSPGSEFEVIGIGGYRFWENERGKGYDETARNFHLFLDDDPYGEILCYAHHCEAKLTLPMNISPGSHVLSVEGGSEITFEVKTDEDK